MLDVAITGVGMLSGHGRGARPLLEGAYPATLACDVRPARRSRNDWSESTAARAGVDDADLAELLAGERRRALSREGSILVAAALLALGDASLDRETIVRGGQRTGVVVASRDAGLIEYVELLTAGVERGPRAVRPARGPQTGLNAPAAELSIRLGAGGPNATFSNGSAGGLDALAFAIGVLRRGAADVMIVGGVDGIAAELGRSSRRSPDHGRGVTTGEAGVVAVLERAEHADSRNARVLAWPGRPASAFSPTGDLREAIRRSLRATLAATADPPLAVVTGCEDDCEADARQASALRSLLGERVRVFALRGMIDDWGGAAALAQLAVATAMLEGRTPPPPGEWSGGESWDPPSRTVPGRLGPGPILIDAFDERCYASSVLVWGERPHAHPGAGARARRTGGDRDVSGPAPARGGGHGC